ncbi:hypothetical protein F4779DRAFT_562363 [Xylariaceae sp. FL0662B]|nr:hypothetical protein F4779DRAFT_562363 [Xylariaceae sp. FL0662B]
MRFHTLATVVVLALANVGACERKNWSGSLASRAKAMVGVPVSPAKRQILLGNGGLGGLGGSGLTLGGVGGLLNSTDSALQDIIDLIRNGQANADANDDSDSDNDSNDEGDADDANNDVDNNTDDAGSDAGDSAANEADAKEAKDQIDEAAKSAEEAEAQQDAKEGVDQADAGEIAAVKESERFADNSGIVAGADGNAVNLGGDLGITKGSDGSVSVGGEAGINIVA